MNLYSSNSICGNCAKPMKSITIIYDLKKLVSGKNLLVVDIFKLI